MTDTVTESVAADDLAEPSLETAAAEQKLIDQLVEQARSKGLKLTGEGGLLQQLTKTVLESALEGEITGHLGYDKHDPAGKDGGSSRNGTRSKTVLTGIGPVEVDVPRDREGSFEPAVVKKRQRRLTGVDEMVLSLSAKGLTHGEISAHPAEVYGANVSRTTIGTITDKVMDGMAEWQSRPLDRVHPAVFIDAINVKIRDGQVANRPIYSVGDTPDVRDLLRCTIEERNLAAAVRAVDAVVEDYCSRAGAALDGRDGGDRSWAAVREAKRHGVPDVVLHHSVWCAHTRLLDRLVNAAVRRRTRAGWHAQELTSFTVRYWEAAAQVYAATEPAGVLAHLLADDGPDTAEAERTLGLCLEEYHWAVVLWSESSRVAQVEDLIRFALTVARTVGGAQPLIVVSRTSEVWMWTRWPKPPVPQALDAACARLALPAGIGVSAGPVRAGAAGFRRSLLAARAGRHEVGGRAGRRWHDFEGVSAMPFLATDDEQSRWFVVEVLGELGYDDPRCVTLRETLRLYLARGRSRQQVAAEMFINRNTVAYRVQQALKLLGRSIDEDAFDVRLALEIARATAARATARRPVDH